MNQLQAEQKIQSLLLYMTESIEKGNWHKIREADRQLMSLINGIKETSWFASFEPKLVSLKRDYETKIQLINAQKENMSKKMQRHQTDSDGILAYKQLTESIGQ
jgi:hypothetical protein